MIGLYKTLNTIYYIIMIYLVIQFFYMEYLIFRLEGFFSTLLPWTWIRIFFGMLASPSTLIPILIAIAAALGTSSIEKKYEKQHENENIS